MSKGESSGKLDFEDAEEAMAFDQELQGATPEEVAEKVSELPQSKQEQFRKRHGVDRVETTVTSVSHVLGEAEQEVTVSAYSWLGFHVFDWILEASWSYNGKTVSDVNISTDARVYDNLWKYNGIVSRSQDVDKHHFTASRQGSMSLLSGPISFNVSPFADVKGYDNGSLDVLESGY